jgi:hypothetical protein
MKLTSLDHTNRNSMVSLITNNTNMTCQSPLLWSQSDIDSRRPILYVCIIGAVTHSVFWLQLVFHSSVRQKTMQWLYVFLITDILFLCRFFFTFTVHTMSNECTPTTSWVNFVCYLEAFVDSYLSLIEVYILLALNLCRYAQIVHNRNVYTANVRLLICAHLAIYLLPVINLVLQIYINWVSLEPVVGDSCYIANMNVYAKVFNVIITYALPIILNILVIYASLYHVHSIARLRRNKNHVTAREKYDRALAIQFLVFYTVWLLLWSPNVIVYQLVPEREDLKIIVRLMNFMGIALDPLIISALDIRFWHVWRNLWISLKNRFFSRITITSKTGSTH